MGFGIGGRKNDYSITLFAKLLNGITLFNTVFFALLVGIDRING
jgi:hypothetical protein